MPQPSKKINSLLRALPSIDQLIETEEVQQHASGIDHAFVVRCARRATEEIRAIVLNETPLWTPDSIRRQAIQRCVQDLRKLRAPSLRKVINCTGIILHTGLGRAALSPAAVSALNEILSGYCNLEFDLASGKRGERVDHVEFLLQMLSGAEAAAVVNNNAAAVLLALNSLADRREVMISRGELIEIGGAFRIPEVMAKSGARMLEVGTTNKTHLHDFRDAITPEAAGFLHVHTSNYRVMGFTAAVSLAELVTLAHEHNLFVINDLGGGILVDFEKYDLPHEPVVQESVAAGADVTTFSGDKVLGGPQAGILVGKRQCIEAIKKNPLMRALRCDKLTYVVLEETLKLFFGQENLAENHRVIQMMSEDQEQIRRRANRVLEALAEVPKTKIEIGIEPAAAQAGSGTLPLEKLPSYAVTFRSKQVHKIADFASRLRMQKPAIVGYLQHDCLYLDMRAVAEGDLPVLIESLRNQL